MRGLETAKRVRFVLQVLLHTSSRYLRHLRRINRAIDALEDQLQHSTRNREVLELLKYQKSLTYFTTALRSNELMMERLQRSQLFNTYPEDEDLLEDVITENQQAIEMTNIPANILSSMMDAFASIISNNLNRVMKLLAVDHHHDQPADHGGQLLRDERRAALCRASLGLPGHPGDLPVHQPRRPVRLLETRLALSRRRRDPGLLRSVSVGAETRSGRLAWTSKSAAKPPSSA